MKGMEISAIKNCCFHCSLKHRFNLEILMFVCTNVVAAVAEKQVMCSPKKDGNRCGMYYL